MLAYDVWRWLPRDVPGGFIGFRCAVNYWFAAARRALISRFCRPIGPIRFVDDAGTVWALAK